MMLRLSTILPPRDLFRRFSTTNFPPSERESSLKKLWDQEEKVRNEFKLKNMIKEHEEEKSKETFIKSRDLPRVPNLIAPWQKVWFPNERIILLKPTTLDVTCTDLLFRVSIKLTKHEIKDLLRTVYGFDVKSITTHIRLGKAKYPYGASLVDSKAYRRPTYKYAHVTLYSPNYVPQPSNAIAVEKAKLERKKILENLKNNNPENSQHPAQ